MTNVPAKLQIALTPNGLKSALTISSVPGLPVTLERSAALATWSALATLTNLSGVTQYFDAVTPTLPRRFYRVRN